MIDDVKPHVKVMMLYTVIVFSIGSVLLVVPFVFNVFSRIKGIVSGRIATISAFSADPNANPFAARFLVAMTFLIGLLLSTILIEEVLTYPHTGQDGRDISYTFWAQLILCSIFPLVGIFHSRGLYDSVSPYYCVTVIRCWWVAVPEGISDFIHTVVALAFLGGNSALDLVSALDMRSNGEGTVVEKVAFILSCISVSLFGLLVIVQAACVLSGKGCCCSNEAEPKCGSVLCGSFVKNCCCGCRCDLPHDHDEVEVGKVTCKYCDQQVYVRVICSECGASLREDDDSAKCSAKGGLALSSFIAESMLFIVVVGNTALVSITRSRVFF